MTGIQETIREFLEQYRIPKTAGFIIGVSGGADSITLLHAFKYMNLRIQALHCNFCLRGKESDMDEQFVKRFCDYYGIALSVKKFDTTAYATKKSISIEMAARELRYEWFQEMKQKKKMDYIVVGHHADDVAETIFINLCRGTGIRGLAGIKPVNGDLIRPLLTHSRTDILKYIEDNQLGFRTDSTNNSLDYVRNKIRHLVIPVFKEINPSFLNTMEENCTALQEIEATFHYAIRKLKAEVMEEKDGETLIHIEKTLAAPAPYTLLFEILKPLGFTKTQIRDILNSQTAISGKQFLAGNYVLTKGRTYWRIFKEENQESTDVQINGDGEYRINGKSYRFTTLPLEDEFNIPTDPGTACLDAVKLQYPLTIRNWHNGDRFCPLGMKKLQKKLSDFFTDRKFSAKQKKDCLVLVCNNKIAWIIGYRADDRFKITSTTLNMIKIERI